MRPVSKHLEWLFPFLVVVGGIYALLLLSYLGPRIILSLPSDRIGAIIVLVIMLSVFGNGVWSALKDLEGKG